MTMKPTNPAIALLASALLLAVSVLWIAAPPAAADGKKLQVALDRAPVRLDPSEKSPVLETLEQGAVLTLASPVKSRTSWYYVYFTSLQTGNTRAGYIHESHVRKLYASVKVIMIKSGDEILDPAEIDLDTPLQPNLEWGTNRAGIIRAEGRPQSQDIRRGVEIMTYRREIMAKQCQVQYVLEANRLVAARVHLVENYADKGRYIEDYNRLHDFLVAKVGAPRTERTVWQDRSYERQSDCWGIALSQGHVEFTSEWVYRDTEVRLLLAGANNHVSLDAELSDVKTKKPASY
jgi:hypothetical protein